MTNIIHLSPTYYSPSSVIGGGERYVIYCARALLLAGRETGQSVKTSLIAFGDVERRFPVADNVECHVLVGRPWDVSSLYAQQVRHAIREADAVFVHQCLSPFGLFLSAQAKIAGKLVVGYDHGGGEHPLIPHTPESGRLFDYFQAFSNFGAQAYLDIHGDVELVRGPVDTEFYTPAYGAAVDRKLVVSVGRIMPHKGFDRTVAALPDGLTLRIIGGRVDEGYFNHLKMIAREKSVEFLDDLDDAGVREQLRGAGLFVHASTHNDYTGRHHPKPELLGLAPLEALACGTPTLVSNAGALPELGMVQGCDVFNGDDDLRGMLKTHAQGLYDWPDRETIHADLDRKFGLAQFGRAVLERVNAGLAK